VATSAWDLYLRTVVDLEISHDNRLRISPAPSGVCGKWPDPFSPPVFILTAWNPGADPLPIELNRTRQLSLESELVAENVTMWRAVGRDPDSEYFEEAIAIDGLDEEAVISAARRYDQDAVFCWTPSAWATVSCADRSRIEIGWRVELQRPKEKAPD
jgi:hypothetical protein